MNRHFYGWMGRLLTVAAFLMLVCNGLNAKPISRAQALLTCTDQADFIGARPACVLRVENGVISQQE